MSWMGFPTGRRASESWSDPFVAGQPNEQNIVGPARENYAGNRLSGEWFHSTINGPEGTWGAPIAVGREIANERINVTSVDFFNENAEFPALADPTINSRRHIWGLAIGIIILDTTSPSTHGRPPPRVLLLKRRSTKTFRPGMWQIPGAKVHLSDRATMKDAITDILYRDTGLSPRKFLAEIQPIQYFKPVPQGGKSPFLPFPFFRFLLL
ncbi:MAG: hypothetical protein Q9227_001850 [Pyrenula ochraceoflavens]